MEPVYEPVSNGRDAKGRNKEHPAAQHLSSDEQAKHQKGQAPRNLYDTGPKPHSIGMTRWQRAASVPPQIGGKDFENDHISYLP